MDADAMHDRLRTARVARLATVDTRHRPALVPCVFALAAGSDPGTQVVYSAVDEKPKTTRKLGRLRNIEVNPEVTLLVDHYDDDWSRLWWVRVRGRARVLRDGDERRRALDLLADKYPQYGEQRPRGPVIAVDVTEWRSWEATPPRGP